jgi:hypothetical protein
MGYRRSLWIVAAFVQMLLPSASRADGFVTNADSWAVLCDSGCRAASSSTTEFAFAHIAFQLPINSGADQLELWSKTPQRALESSRPTNLPPVGSTFSANALTATFPLTLPSGTIYWLELIPASRGGAD